MEEFQHFQSEADANQQQDSLSDGFVRLDSPADSDLQQAKASDTAEEDLYSATPSDDQPGYNNSDLVSFDSSPTEYIDSPALGTVSAPADSSSDPEPFFTQEPISQHDDDAPVEDLLGGFGSTEREAPMPSNPVEPEPKKSKTPDGDFSNLLQETSPVVELDEAVAETQSLHAAPQSQIGVEELFDEVASSPALISASPSEGALIDLSRLDPRVVDLVYWRDPKKSGVAFVFILTILLAFSCFSSISVVAYLLLSILTVSISFRVYKSVLQAVQKTGDGNPFKPYLEMDISISKDDVSHYAVESVDKINQYAASLRRLIFVEDLIESIKFAVLLWLLTYIGCMFNGLTLIIFAHIGLFSLPLIYEKNKTQIDDALGKANTNLKTIVNQVKEKVPFLKKKTE